MPVRSVQTPWQLTDTSGSAAPLRSQWASSIADSQGLKKVALFPRMLVFLLFFFVLLIQVFLPGKDGTVQAR